MLCQIPYHTRNWIHLNCFITIEVTDEPPYQDSFWMLIIFFTTSNDYYLLTLKHMSSNGAPFVLAIKSKLITEVDDSDQHQISRIKLYKEDTNALGTCITKTWRPEWHAHPWWNRSTSLQNKRKIIYTQFEKINIYCLFFFFFFFFSKVFRN